MKDVAELDKNKKAWELLFRTFKLLERAREMELEQFGLSPIGAGVLDVLKNAEEPVTPSVLSRLLLREPHTMSGLIKRMEAQGLVKRSKDLEKKNLVRVTLTKKGEQAFQWQSGAGVTPRITSCLSKKEFDNLEVYLGKLETRALGIIRDLQPAPYT